MPKLHPDIYFHRIIIYVVLACIVFSISPAVGYNAFLFGFCWSLAVINLFNFIRSLRD